MQVSVEKVNSVERRLTVVIPANEVEKEYKQQIQKLVKNVKLKGFRPGKVSPALIEQRFGADARREAVNKVMKDAVYAAIVKEKLQPVSTPSIEPKVLEPNQPLEFIISFEVLPEIEEVAFTAPPIEKLKVEITEDDIQKVLQQLQKQYTDWKLVDRPAQMHDRVVIDYHLVTDGKAELENKVENYPLELGSKIMLQGFEEGLIGSSANETKTLNLTFPADFPIAERAGKTADFVINVKQVFEGKKPEFSENFIEKLGIKGGKLDELQKQIRLTLSQERDRIVKEKLKEQLFTKLLEQNPLEVPKSLVEREAKVIHDEVFPHHAKQKNHHHDEKELENFREIAKKRVALGLLIAEYARKTELKPDKNRVDERIKEIASAYESPQEVIQWLGSNQKRGEIEGQVLEDQVLDKLLEGAEVTEREMSYSELKGTKN